LPRHSCVRAGVHPAPGPGDVAHDVLALRVRRRAGRRRDLRPAWLARPAAAPGWAGVSRLEPRDVRTFYGTVCALDGFSLAIDAGQFVSIIGPNGAGKTTLMNVLTGLLAPTSGTVRFKDAD